MRWEEAMAYHRAMDEAFVATVGGYVVARPAGVAVYTLPEREV